MYIFESKLIKMPANVESMFYVRKTHWHGLGVKVEEALSSRKTLELGGLDWKVIRKEIYTDSNMLILWFINKRYFSKNLLYIIYMNPYNL